MPSEPKASFLQAQIKKLAGQFETVSFPPHITLIGRLTRTQSRLVTKAQALTADLPPLTVTLKGYGWRNTYFRCFYLKVAHSREIELAQKAIKKHFGLKGALSEPHLSLVYGHLGNESKEGLAKELSTLDKMRVRFETIRLVAMSQSLDPKTWRDARLLQLGSNRKQRSRSTMTAQRASLAAHHLIRDKGVLP